jgi:membrane associated rhomboid family serine protease
MPDAWDFTQKPQRAGPVVQTPLLTYLLTGLSLVLTVAYLYPNLLSGNLWMQLVDFDFREAEGASPRSLLTNIFIHGSWLHLLFDMIWLVQIGRILEGTLSPLIYLAFIVGAAAIGSACQVLISGSTGIGMSGVVYAMFALMWAGRGVYPAWGAIATRDNLRLFIGWGLFCLVATYIPALHFGIANGAHGGGFLFGLCIGFLFFNPRRRWVWAAPLALLIGVVVFSAIRLHAT